MAADLNRFFCEDATDDPEFAGWLLDKASEIVDAELREGESEWDLFQRRNRIDSPRVRRALDILDRAGFIDDPTVLEEEDRDVEQGDS